jgi:carboxyl-terminal processing protease
MRRAVKITLIVAVVCVMMLASFTAGAFLGGPLARVQAQSGWQFTNRFSIAQPEEFDVFWQAWDIVQDNFVDQEALNDTQLTYGAIEGMLNALGDQGHTTFLTPEELLAKREDISGRYSGIGARVGVKDMLPVIVAPFDGSPADKAGIKAGDIIMAVDGDDTSGRDLEDIIDQIRGEEGSEVVLTILRIDNDETKSMEIPIIRGEIEIPAATWTMIPETDVGLVRLNQFSVNATDHLVESIESAEAAGAAALVLDIRNNPGGLLEQAINVTSQFLTEGNVLQEENAEGERRVFKVRNGGVATDIPLVVLINEGSASSSEILAGAIQDHERGTLVGETTFGTGTVLEPFTLQDGSALMLGTRQWLTADGRLIRKQGIEPDILIDLPIEADLLSPDEIEEMALEELTESEDVQLLQALEMLGAVPEGTVATKQAEAEEALPLLDEPVLDEPVTE